MTTKLHKSFRKPRYNTHWVPFRYTTSYIHFGRIQSTRCPYFFPGTSVDQQSIVEGIGMFFRLAQYL
ncbi:hypothetical protein [Paracnuella aquatica]|uniref:hypothetical protein n=1 Tax=Paracnuella aquatica TaxID=2268757 RepID=UPI000F50F5CA|nr:hypothetical protein [Paracnuella aquatica]RPD44018.1 hypothetical protein DRJ53_18190 [Paracnuella aquatica]